MEEKSMNILLLEDELGIRSFVKVNLKREGYTVIEASSGEEAIEKLEKEKIDIALLDVMLPGISGFDVCKYIREKHKNIRVIMVTAKGQEEDKISGLSYGADDYVVKPFSVKELIARVHAQKRRVEEVVILAHKDENILEVTPFKLDVRQRRFEKDGVEVELTPTEFSIIKLLMTHKGEPLSRNEILDQVWGSDYVGDYKIVDVNVRRIRSKIEGSPSKPEHLKTVWGYGYSWRKEE